jgi:CDP-diacylglycerol--glycerol-3-phosphate 3-phosphatidyltransferase
MSPPRNESGADRVTGDVPVANATDAPAAEPRATSFGPSALWTPANALTLARIAASPVIFWMILTGEMATWPVAALSFVVGVTDGFDGWLARKYGTTRSGAFLDPLADKILVLGAMICIASTGRWPWLPVVVVGLRELAISALRSYWGKKGLAIQASALAKAKTVILSFACLFTLVPVLADDPAWPADGLLAIGVVVALVSGAQYVVAGSRATTTMAR